MTASSAPEEHEARFWTLAEPMAPTTAVDMPRRADDEASTTSSNLVANPTTIGPRRVWVASMSVIWRMPSTGRLAPTAVGDVGDDERRFTADAALLGAAPDSWVGITQEPLRGPRNANPAERTRLELEHRNIERHGPGWEGVRDGVAADAGWTLYLDRYADLLASVS